MIECKITEQEEFKQKTMYMLWENMTKVNGENVIDLRRQVGKVLPGDTWVDQIKQIREYDFALFC